ncbi:hypothetical protein Mp_3g08190 [Marchantia polymorpha subsp. ruderalis]|uniref:Uncharacterized protein n=2 Tax=Marchantia polymorpha TaxID=3197 RepID=A0AAF6AYL7_MARPO|nr:hypothetical protein MARPO_0006s0293 [Marchantia polymorpha]BBN04851.1 hypothetical protein Mp_3g08190 [Marchantia polymorpha subsp. ruderalis]|eukprot:PTQ48302.1 hypothetical protein MARPO_0006s0293 [Marchantia polymorpha]
MESERRESRVESRELGPASRRRTGEHHRSRGAGRAADDGRCTRGRRVGGDAWWTSNNIVHRMEGPTTSACRRPCMRPTPLFSRLEPSPARPRTLTRAAPPSTRRSSAGGERGRGGRERRDVAGPTVRRGARGGERGK